MPRRQSAIRCQRCGRRTRRWEIKYVNWRPLPEGQLGWRVTQAKWCVRCARRVRLAAFQQKLAAHTASLKRMWSQIDRLSQEHAAAKVDRPMPA